MPPTFWIPVLFQFLVLAVVAIVVAALAVVALFVAAAAASAWFVLHLLGWDRRALAWLARRTNVRVTSFHFQGVKPRERDYDWDAPIEANWTMVEERRPD